MKLRFQPWLAAAALALVGLSGCGGGESAPNPDPNPPVVTPAADIYANLPVLSDNGEGDVGISGGVVKTDSIELYVPLGALENTSSFRITQSKSSGISEYPSSVPLSDTFSISSSTVTYEYPIKVRIKLNNYDRSVFSLHIVGSSQNIKFEFPYFLDAEGYAVFYLPSADQKANSQSITQDPSIFIASGLKAIGLSDLTSEGKCNNINGAWGWADFSGSTITQTSKGYYCKSPWNTAYDQLTSELRGYSSGNLANANLSANLKDSQISLLTANLGNFDAFIRYSGFNSKLSDYNAEGRVRNNISIRNASLFTFQEMDNLEADIDSQSTKNTSISRLLYKAGYSFKCANYGKSYECVAWKNGLFDYIDHETILGGNRCLKNENIQDSGAIRVQLRHKSSNISMDVYSVHTATIGIKNDGGDPLSDASKNCRADQISAIKQDRKRENSPKTVLIAGDFNIDPSLASSNRKDISVFTSLYAEKDPELNLLDKESTTTTNTYAGKAAELVNFRNMGSNLDHVLTSKNIKTDNNCKVYETKRLDSDAWIFDKVYIGEGMDHYAVSCILNLPEPQYVVKTVVPTGVRLVGNEIKTITRGSSTMITFLLDDKYEITGISGCGGTPNKYTSTLYPDETQPRLEYSTGPITQDCTVTITSALKPVTPPPVTPILSFSSPTSLYIDKLSDPITATASTGTISSILWEAFAPALPNGPALNSNLITIQTSNSNPVRIAVHKTGSIILRATATVNGQTVKRDATISIIDPSTPQTSFVLNAAEFSTDPATITRNTSSNIRLKISNSGNGAFSGVLAVGLDDQQGHWFMVGSPIRFNGSQQPILQPGQTSAALDFSHSFSSPASSTPYTLKVFYGDTVPADTTYIDPSWKPLAQSTTLTVKEPTTLPITDLSGKWISAPSQVKQGDPLTIKINVANAGNVRFKGLIGVALAPAAQQNNATAYWAPLAGNSAVFTDADAFDPPPSTKTFDLPFPHPKISSDPGEYVLRMFYTTNSSLTGAQNYGTSDWKWFGSAKALTVTGSTAVTPLTIDSLVVEPNPVEQYKQLIAYGIISNASSAPFTGRVAVGIATASEASKTSGVYWAPLAQGASLVSALASNAQFPISFSKVELQSNPGDYVLKLFYTLNTGLAQPDNLGTADWIPVGAGIPFKITAPPQTGTTTLTAQGLTLTPSLIKQGDTFTLKARVTNTGTATVTSRISVGADLSGSAQNYTVLDIAWASLTLNAGQSTDLTFNGNWVNQAGTFNLRLLSLPTGATTFVPFGDTVPLTVTASTSLPATSLLLMCDSNTNITAIIGQSLNCQAKALDDTGKAVTPQPAMQYQVTPSGYATIDQNGLFIAKAAGQVTVTAISGSLTSNTVTVKIMASTTGTAQLVVVNPAISPSQIKVGDQVKFTATVKNSGDAIFQGELALGADLQGNGTFTVISQNGVQLSIQPSGELGVNFSTTWSNPAGTYQIRLLQKPVGATTFTPLSAGATISVAP